MAAGGPERLRPQVSSGELLSGLFLSPCRACVCTFGSGSNLTGLCRGRNANLRRSASALVGFCGYVYLYVVNTLWQSVSAHLSSAAGLLRDGATSLSLASMSLTVVVFNVFLCLDSATVLNAFRSAPICVFSLLQPCTCFILLLEQK